MMRCLVVHNRYRSAEPSGENVVVDAEVDQLRRRGHTVGLWQLDSDSIATSSPMSKARLPARAVWSRSAARALQAVAADFAPDVVHVHNVFPLISPSILPMLHSLGVPTVATVHNYRLVCAGGSLYRDGRPCHDCVGRVQWRGPAHGCYRGSRLATAPIAIGNTVGLAHWRNVDVLLALSNTQRSMLTAAGIAPERIVVKPNFVEAPTTASGRTAGSADSAGRFTYVGRLTDTKGIPSLIEAWQELERRGRRVPLTIIGNGPLASDVAAFSEQRPHVEFAGHVPRRVAISAMSGATAVLTPSSWEEAFGLTVIEAMSVGRPVIATAHGSFPDLVTDGIDGLLVPPDAPSALADAVCRMLDDRCEAARMGRHASCTYEERFTPDVVMQQLEAAYGQARRTRDGQR